jgi:hypothetical protein
MEQTQTIQHTGETKINITGKKDVSFDDISLNHISYNESFRVCLGSAGQIVKAIGCINEQLVGSEHEQKKLSENKYQETLYPELTKLTKEIVDKYNEVFMSDINDPIKRQVFGANLNGGKNIGVLSRNVLVRGVKFGLKYKFSQFGQLLNTLIQRFEYIHTRDPMAVERYKNSEVERNNFKLLQDKSDYFIKFITNDVDGIYVKWNAVVAKARENAGVTKSKRHHESKHNSKHD